MSGASVLAAASAVAAIAAARELAADHGEIVAERVRRRIRRLPGSGRGVGGVAGRFGVARRIRRAGLDGSLAAGTVVAAKVGGGILGLAVWAMAAASMALRPALLLLGVCLAAGFLAPDVVLERRARERRAVLLAELADGLDLIALEIGAGGGVRRALQSAAMRGRGPLGDELGRAVAAVEAGGPTGAVLAELGVAAGLPQLTLAGRALERSHRLGVPLGEELEAQAVALRRERSRAIRERADRAGPKIQLVVALVLVPAVLLVIVAALVAHAGSLTAGL